MSVFLVNTQTHTSENVPPKHPANQERKEIDGMKAKFQSTLFIQPLITVMVSKGFTGLHLNVV